ncbi:MAG: alpha/beta hydrolase [Turicibacter sp.]|nr:alpha/beta hydrolase [Turicibacter sp.]
MKKDFTEEYVPINGIEQYFLHYPAEAEEVVLMLHGGPGFPNSYTAYYVHPFLDFCNVVYYDQRGAGKTQLKNRTNPDTLSYTILLEDLHRTVQYVKEKYKTERVLLAGHSCGSLLGTQYILKYPNDVLAYIGYGQMVESKALHRIWYMDLRKTIEKSKHKRDLKKMAAISSEFPNVPMEQFVAGVHILTDMHLKYSYGDKNYMSIFRRSPIMTFKDGMIMMRAGKNNEKLIEETYGFDISDIALYQLPIFYVLGRYDALTSSELAAEYFEKISAPKKGLYWIENAGHMTDTDQPEAFGKAILDIIEACN